MPLYIPQDLIDSIHEGTYQETSCDVILWEEATDLLEDESDVIQLDENVFQGLPSTTIKALTGGANKSGAQSEVVSHIAKSKAAIAKALKDALNNNNGVVVYRGGKMVASVHPAGYSDKNVNFIDASGTIKQFTGMRSVKTRRGYTQHKYTYVDIGRGVAVDYVVAAIEAAGGFNETVEIKQFKADIARRELNTERIEARKQDKNNPRSFYSINQRAIEKMASGYLAGSFDTIVQSAVSKMSEIVSAIKDEDLKTAGKLATELASLLNNETDSKDYKQAEYLFDMMKSEGAGLVATNRTGRFTRKYFIEYYQKLKNLNQ